MYYIIDVLKAIACLLIANFHSDILFPDNLSILAFGGDIGNNIFFLISGFTLLPSVERCKKGDWWKWYTKRLMRICPMIFTFYVVTWMTGGVQIRTFTDVFTSFIFPTLYWFTGAILFLYVLYYIVEKCFAKRWMHFGICIILIILHLVFDGIYAERYLIGFLAMLAGAQLRRTLQNLHRIQSNFYLLGAAFFAVVYCVLKLLRAKGIEMLGLIHLSIGLLTILIAGCALIWGILNDEVLKLFFSRHTKIWASIHAIAGITMTVYLFMGLNDRAVMKWFLNNLSFPASYVGNMIFSLLIAYMLTRLEKCLRKKFFQ